MGGTTFEHMVIGRDPEEAFKRAHEEATYEYGHGGYSGSIAEKPGFTIIQRQPLSLTEANALADKLISVDDPRVCDKWGDAGAIPVILETRDVQVGPFDYTPSGPNMSVHSSIEPNLLAAVEPLVKLRRGETIESVSLNVYSSPDRLVHSRGYGGFGPERRTACQAKVTIRKPSLTREVEFSVTLPNLTNNNGLDYPKIQEALEKHAASNVRLNKGEHLVSVRQLGSTPGKSKVVALAPKDKTETRFIVKPGHEHGSWERGLSSQAEARAWATKHANTLDSNATFEIEGVTRRVTGAPLVSVHRVIAERTYTALAIASKDVAGETEGWLFFGWAST